MAGGKTEVEQVLKILTVFGDGGRHAGRVSRGPGYEMTFSQFFFDDYARLEGPGGTELTVIDTPLKATLKEIAAGKHAVKCDGTDAFFLRYSLEAAGGPELPFLIVESDLFDRARRVCAFYERESGKKVFERLVARTDNYWLAISRAYFDYYIKSGVPAENLFHFPMSVAGIGFSFPGLAEQVREPLPERDWSGAVRAIRGNALAVGTHERDYETLALAVRGLPFKVHVICDLGLVKPVESRELVWHDSMPQAQFVEAIRQSAFVVAPLKPAERNFGQMGAALPMALGKAVIATDVEALRDHVLRGRTGETVRASDADALREAIIKLMRDADLCARYGKDAAAVERGLSATASQTVEKVLARVRQFHGIGAGNVKQ